MSSKAVSIFSLVILLIFGMAVSGMAWYGQ